MSRTPCAPWPTRLTCILLGGLVLVGSVHARVEARTWRVEKDGSGDFTQIQAAIDAAAPGDTILVGPGRYTEVRDFQLDCCLTMPTYVGIATENLTIIGAHRDSVVIGPDAFVTQEVIVGMRVGAASGFTLQSVTIQQGVNGTRVMDLARVSDVRIRDCWIGAFASPDSGALFENCLFERSDNVAIGAGNGSRNISVIASEFVDNDSSVNFTWSENPRVERCSFRGAGTTRIVASGEGTHLLVSGCTIEGGTNYGIAALASSEVTILDSDISTSGGAPLWCRNAAGFEVRRNRISGGWYATLRITYQPRALVVRNNQFDKGSGFVVRLDDFPEWLGEVAVDLRENYWSTTEPESLAAWVSDGQDDPEVHARAVLRPLLTAPVTTSADTMGGVKALFGHRRSPR